jgi:hypothetical protein
VLHTDARRAVQLPVLRALLRALNNVRIGATGTIATYVPLRKNIEFHKVSRGLVRSVRRVVTLTTARFVSA